MEDDSDSELVTVEFDENLEIVEEITEPELIISVVPKEEPTDKTHRVKKCAKFEDDPSHKISVVKEETEAESNDLKHIPDCPLHTEKQSFVDIAPIDGYQPEDEPVQHVNTPTKTDTGPAIEQADPFGALVIDERVETTTKQDSVASETFGVLSRGDEEDRVYECSRCAAVFEKFGTAKTHMSERVCGATGDTYWCYKCDKYFTALFTLRRHMKETHHVGKKRFVCEVCGWGCNNKSSHKRHMLIHIDQKIHECSVCKKTFRLKNNYQRHMMTHTGERPYPCEICGKRFRVADHLKKHVYTHTDKMLFSCDVCDKPMKSEYSLRRHKLTHSSARPHKCDECGAAFKKREHLKQHRQNVHKSAEKRLSCELCDAEFTRQVLLDNHLKTHRKSETKKKTGVKRLDTHLEQDHSQAFECETCGALFATQQKLSTHIRCHQKTRTRANESSRTKDTPRRQKDTQKHNLSDEVAARKPNKCGECGETFRSARALGWHQESHTGKGRYTCSHCDEKFKDLRSLKDHMWDHSGVKSRKKTHSCN